MAVAVETVPVTPSIATAEGRRFWSFIAIWIGCVVFTLFAAVAVYLVSGHQLYSLILGLAAHVQLLLGMGAFSFVLGRRMSVKGGRDGFEYSDKEEVERAAQVVADAAQTQADVVKESGP